MATISSLGIGSGLDLSSIVTGLVDAERVPTEQRLSFKEETITAKLSAFGALKSSLSLFQGSLSGLLSTSTYDFKSVSTSDDSVFSTSVTSNADNGNYSVEVTKLAQSHSLASSAASVFADINDTVGTGTLMIEFGTTTTGPYSFTQDISKAAQNIVVSEANNNTTLTGLKDYINNNDFGVSASIINDGSGYRLTLTSENTGANNSMEITVTGDGDGNNNDNAGLSQLAFNASAQSSMTQTVVAQDAELTINGLDITRETNTVSGAIDGVTLNLLKTNSGSLVNVSVSENIDDLNTGIQEFVQGYNGLVETLNTLTKYDPDTGSSGLLIGDSTVRGIRNQLRGIISNSVSELSGNVQSLADIGIKTNISGTLDLDVTKLNTALNNFPTEVTALFSLQGRPSDSNINYLSATDNTQAGDYAVDITTMASQGVLNGTAINNLTIDDNNDGLTVKIDGITSGSLLLTQGTYADGDALAAHIQAQINDDTNIKNGGASVSVTYDSINNRFDITSTRYGSESKVEILSVDPNSSNDLGLSVAAGTDGVDIAGTINGTLATGDGQILTSASGASEGLALLIASGTTGNRGSVSFSRGIAVTLEDIVANFLDNDGFISTKEDGLTNDLKDINDQREQLSTRIASLEARLVAQFSALDSLIATFNATSTYLEQQLQNLPKPNSVGNNN